MARPRSKRILVVLGLVVAVVFGLVVAVATAGAVLYLNGCSLFTVEEASSPAEVFSPEPPPTFSAEGIRLATLNAEFLFDGVGHEGGATFPHKGDPQKARAHLERIAEVVRMLDADVLVLQEVENENVLDALAGGPLAEMQYEVHFVEGADTFTGQDVGLLSRVPVDTLGRTDLRAAVGASGDTYGVSKNLFARLTFGDVPATVIGLHFLARPDDPERVDRRQAQAEVIRRLVVSEMALGRAVAVVGDFNDFDDVTRDRYDNTPITDVLNRIKAAGPGPSDDLRNVLAEVPPEERYTSFYDRDDDGLIEAGELSAIDHILLSPQLFQRLREVIYVQAHDPRTYTDHFPVVVTLED